MPANHTVDELRRQAQRLVSSDPREARMLRRLANQLDAEAKIRAREPNDDEPHDPEFLAAVEDATRSGEDIEPRFVVIESTPGYLADDDEPFTTDKYSDAVAHAHELADELEEAGYITDRSWASSDNLLAIKATREDTVAPDLGRYVEIVRDTQDA